MEKYFYRDGKEVEPEKKVTPVNKTTGSVMYQQNCFRCGGTGHYSIGVCFRCNGSKKEPAKPTKVYTAEKLAKLDEAKNKRWAKKEAQRKIKAEIRINEGLEIAKNIEGFDEALAKAQLIVSSGTAPTKGKSYSGYAEDIKTLADMISNNYWTKKSAEYLINVVDRVCDKEKKIITQTLDEDLLRSDPNMWVKSGRYEITGKITAIKEYENKYDYNQSYIYKCMIIDNEGRKYWGSLPKHVPCDGIGRTITLTATFEKSDDPIFGFYKRPSKVTVSEKT